MTTDDSSTTREHPTGEEDADVRGGVEAARRELSKMRDRMSVIREEVALEVNRNWASPWRTPATFDLKVQTRLTGHQEYRSLQARVRDAEAGLAAASGAAETDEVE